MAKLRHIAMAVPDLEAAAAFYEKTFELERVKQTRKRIYLSDGTMNLTLLPSDDLAGDGIWQRDRHAARADLLRRAGRLEEAAAVYRRAIELSRNEADRRFLEQRVRDILP